MGDDFLERVERAITESGLTPTAFGREAIGDPTYVFYLRKGRESRSETRAAVTAFIEKLAKRRSEGRAA
jgi:homoserine dehydrogenase